MMKLTPKQQKFVDAYAGNATEAARIAGYAHPGQQGERLLKKVEIVQGIDARETPERSARIGTREERQEFWTNTMRDAEKTMRERLRASELLGRSEGDFLDRTDHRHSFTGPDGKPLKYEVITNYVSVGEVDRADNSKPDR